MKANQLSFFSQELIDLVNKTNSKLLYAELLTKASESVQRKKRLQTSTTSIQDQTPNDELLSEKSKDFSGEFDDEDESDDYSLLNAFEVLWAPGSKEIQQAQSDKHDQLANKIIESESQIKDEIELVANCSIDQMDLVDIRSHTVHENSANFAVDAPNDSKSQQLALPQQKEESKRTSAREEAKKCFALTVKDSYINNILTICQKIRPQTFLQSSQTTIKSDEERPIVCPGNYKELIVV